jgi:hypothetical protein
MTNKVRILAGVIMAGAVALASATPASALTIDFDDLGNGVVVTNQYSEATFGSTAGFQIMTTAQNAGSTLPNFICTAAVGDGINCTQDVIVAFANPVNNLTFLAVGDNMVGVNGLVDVYDIGGLIGTADIVGDDVYGSPFAVDLSGYANVTSITIRAVTDPGGLGYDDFSFEVGAVTATPEPASMALLGVGVLALARARRR